MFVAIVVFGCFKSRSGVASLLAFCCIVSSSWCRQGIHTTPRPGPSESETPPAFLLVARAVQTPRGARET
jgi:hypothetical protein